MDVQFEDNSIYVKAEIKDAVIAALYECAGELVSQTQRNCRTKTGDTKNAWTYKVDENEGMATIGNPLENSIWEEFGTGEYAVNGDGRKGGWTYQDKMGKYHHTRGKTPTRAFETAYNSTKQKIIRRIESALKGLG